MNTSARTVGINGGIVVTVTDAAGREAVERAKKLLDGIPGGVDRAMKSAVRSAERTLRSGSKKAILEKYDISGAGLRLEADGSRQGRAQKESNVSVRYSYQNGVQATVTFSGHKLPLYRFGGSPKTPEVHRDWTVQAIVKGERVWVHPSVQASGHQLRSTSPSPLAKYGNDAFVRRMPKSGHIGIFARTGGQTAEDSEAIEELMGPSVAQMVGNQEVAEKLTEEAYRSFETELDKAVYRILTGWR